MQPRDLLLKPLPGIPRIAKGGDLAGLTLKALPAAGIHPAPGDVLVFAQKIVSKAEGRAVDLASVTPSSHAQELTSETGKDARVVELILQESNEVPRKRPGLIVVVDRLGPDLNGRPRESTEIGFADEFGGRTGGRGVACQGPGG